MQRSSEDFIELLKPIYSNAISYCIALTRNETEAKDLLQDSLLKALEKFTALRDDTKFKPWLFTILTRRYYALYQKSLIKKNFLNESYYYETVEFPQIFEKETNELNQKALLEALGLITEKERVAIVLFEVGDFSMEEIRMIQGEKSLSAVKSRISRTRIKLKELILAIQKTLTNR
jgi:RNA polymerase sigma-70 factor (ECF subfamily)